MKKLFTFVFLAVAIVGFGKMAFPAHAAASLTPEQTAALQTQLDALKANLTQLQLKAAQPAIPVPQKTSALTAEDAAALRSALSSLVTALGNLQAEFTTHPELAQQNAPAIFNALQGMTKTLAAISTSVGSVNAGSIALAPPAVSGKIVVRSAPILAPAAQAVTPTIPTVAALTPSATPTQPLVSANTNQAASADNQVAQIGSASSFKNMNWPLIVVVILVIAAVALWLFWPESDGRKKVVKATASHAPAAPVATVMPQSQSQPHVQPQQHQPQSQQQSQQQRRPA